MEYVVLGLLGLYAHAHMSSTSSNSALTSKDKDQDQVVQVDPQTMRELERAFRQDVAKHMANPNVVKPMNPNGTSAGLMPFFRSEKKQTTSDTVKDQRLEAFTGRNNTEFSHKQELQAPNPRPQDTGRNLLFDTENNRKRIENESQVIQKNNNVLPFQQIRVGPGLGINTDTPAADGFHSQFRILPDNVNSYRKNAFAADVIHGHHAVQTRTADPAALSVGPGVLTEPEFELIGARGFDAPTAASHNPAFASRSGCVEPSRFHTMSECESRDPRNVSGVGVGTVAPSAYSTPDFLLASDANRCAFGVGGVGAGPAAAGGYHVAQFLIQDTDRETPATATTNTVALAGPSGTYVVSDPTRTETLRGQANCRTGQATASTHFASTAPITDTARPTLKQQTLTNSLDYGLVNAGTDLGHTARSATQIPNTLRGLGGQAGVGPAGHLYGNHIDRTQACHLEHCDKATLVSNYSVNGNFSKLNLSQPTAFCATEFSADCHPNRILSNVQGKGFDTHTSSTQMGCVSTVANRPPEANTRAFGYTVPNEFRLDITKPATR